MRDVIKPQEPHRAMQDQDLPLCVDMDGTLIRTDLLHEAALILVRRNPLVLFRFLAWIVKGGANLKRQIALRAQIDVASIPYDERVLDWLRDRKGKRPPVLCTASDEILGRQVAAHVGLFDGVIGSDGVHNLAGFGKRDVLCERYGERGFDYAGNAAPDLRVWPHARRAIVVNASARVLRRAQAVSEVELVFPHVRAGWRAWLVALRVHQWPKNALVLVPLGAAHLAFAPMAVMSALIAFLAFSLCASGAYVLNDLFDLEADRQHPRKRQRPFACGSLSIRSGLVASALLTLAAFTVASALSPRFMGVLLVYAIITLTYSLTLKRVVILDVVTLAVLYTTRIIGGAVAIAVPTSLWLLAFSMFLFLSLAIVKRYAEVHRIAATSETKVAGRGYAVDDLPLIQSLGMATGYLSVLVLAFYINSTKSTELYRHHHVLWLLTPLLLYWISRVWLLARRGGMHDDPVVFALTDKVSLAVLGIFGLVIFLAI